MTPTVENSLITLAAAGDVDLIWTLLTTIQEPLSEDTIQHLLTAAAKGSHLNIITFILAQYPSISLEEEVIRAAVYTGSIPIFKALLAQDPRVVNMRFDKRGTPLIVACTSRQPFEYLKFLLDAGADPNQDPECAVFPLAIVSAFYNDPAVIDLLLQHGARLEDSGALPTAARFGNEPMLRRLLDRGTQLDSIHASPLHAATRASHGGVKAGHVSVVKTLLQHGADADVADSSGATAVELANQLRSQGKDILNMMDVLTGDQGAINT
ncbi:ankyrin repeat-containing domain protein [Fusarium acuminatum]|uniref:Ankyrin repeat-containing domain protein n=1 Tax=Fusarium acuminatum TaxID=5515 RepID=A0ABZ2WP50_9HYPO